MGSISIRQSIRWLPDEAEEPTSTIVLTSPQRRFVDLRVFKPSPDSDTIPKGQLDPWQLEWGIAGTSSTRTRTGDGGEVITRGRWDHWIDSRTPEFVYDEGDMFPMSDTLTLEKGSMVNPATGKETAYEEVWEDSEPMSVPGSGRTCAVLRMETEKREEKGLMVVLGRRCQVLARIGEDVTAERWDWDEQDGWVRTLWMGETALPGKGVLEKMDKLAEGDVHEVAGYSWKVVELA
ncbi:protein HRI1 domain-containing protein [Sarocladium implicatum]|nr:protein HRI1 domain-containing protein [Sarocladium implicatum]